MLYYKFGKIKSLFRVGQSMIQVHHNISHTRPAIWPRQSWTALTQVEESAFVHIINEFFYSLLVASTSETILFAAAGVVIEIPNRQPRNSILISYHGQVCPYIISKGMNRARINGRQKPFFVLVSSNYSMDTLGRNMKGFDGNHIKVL